MCAQKHKMKIQNQVLDKNQLFGEVNHYMQKFFTVNLDFFSDYLNMFLLQFSVFGRLRGRMEKK